MKFERLNLDQKESHNMQPQVHNQGQRRPIPMSANQSQAREQILSQNIRSNMGSSGVQSSASLTSALPPVSGLSPTMQNISEALQSSEVNSMGQVAQHLKQQVQNFLQYLYEQLSNQKFVHQQAIHQQKVMMELQMGHSQQLNLPEMQHEKMLHSQQLNQLERQQQLMKQHQQMKSGVSFPISSPQSSQSFQAASPHLSEHSSPKVDQQNLLSFLSKAETPLQSGTANSPFYVASPSTQLAPSPMPGDFPKSSI
ncbi:mediator of RNA polymerase II transcription subunit 15a-like [Euphorbia lathyris]|uniref:mediator of RNA polymerase II transcription subunit 15a-like n=1 Tax=Euphorbia lathyris TaxID=212925 RepID=UPI00331443F7